MFEFILTEFSANVVYQELDIPLDFPFHLRKFIPNTFYNADSQASQFNWLVSAVQAS